MDRKNLCGAEIECFNEFLNFPFFLYIFFPLKHRINAKTEDFMCKKIKQIDKKGNFVSHILFNDKVGSGSEFLKAGVGSGSSVWYLSAFY